MKRTKKVKNAVIPAFPTSNRFKLEFINFSESCFLITDVELIIETGYMDGEKHLNINFSLYENENYSSWNYFAALALMKDTWVIARLVTYDSNGGELKTINMSVNIKRFVKRLSFNNSDSIKYDIEGIFKFVN